MKKPETIYELATHGKEKIKDLKQILSDIDFILTQVLALEMKAKETADDLPLFPAVEDIPNTRKNCDDELPF